MSSEPASVVTVLHQCHPTEVLAQLNVTRGLLTTLCTDPKQPGPHTKALFRDEALRISELIREHSNRLLNAPTNP